MRTRFSLLLPLVLFWIPISVDAAVREKESLDGVWQFATDPEEVGEKDAWFAPDAQLPTARRDGYAETANGTIRVPGIWDDQGYGVETDKLKNEFVGKGWYKRTFDVPERWRGQRVFVVLGGISRYAKIWINGRFAGPEAIGCIGPHEREITEFVRFGAQNDITVCVDSKQRWEIDTLYGGSTLNDYMEIAWGGLWGRVSVEARPPVRLDSIYLRGDIRAQTCAAETAILSDVPVESGLALRLDVFDKEGTRVARAETPIQDAAQKLAVSATIPNARLWSPDSPYLYDVRLSLVRGDEELDRLTSSFGLRELKFDGDRVILNGTRIFLAGYGDDHIYPEQFAMSSDKRVHLDRLKAIKAFGFNHVRHHSAMMPDEYYQACDELGMLPSCEFLLGYTKFAPGDAAWKALVPPGTTPDAAVATYNDRFRAAVLQYRNHPCIAWWVAGNELYEQERPFTESFKKIVDELDPDRAFVLSDGCSFTPVRAEYQPVRSVQFPEWGDLFATPGKYNTPPENQEPVIVHEMSNYLSFPKLDQAELFEKTAFKPFWFTPGIEKLAKLGLLDETNEWVKTTEKQYLFTNKYNIELVRKNDRISGYHWWLIQDYWTTSNGIFDLFFRPKSYRPADILPFNSAVVLLQDGLKFSCRGEEKLDLNFLVSNFSADDLTGKLVAKFALADGTTEEIVREDVAAPRGGLNRAENVVWTCPNVEKPRYLEISLAFEAGGKTFRNDWSTWIYPKETALPQTNRPIFRDSSLTFLPKNWEIPTIPASGELPADAIYLTTYLDRKAVDFVARGGRAILFGDLDSIANRPIHWQSSWWKAGDDLVMGQYVCGNHTGAYVYPNPATDETTRENWCDISWYELIDGARKDLFDGNVPRPDVMIRTVPSVVKPEDGSVLYQVAVGEGKLIVSKLNHLKAQGLGPNDWLCAKLIELAASDARPAAEWPADKLAPQPSAPNGWTVGYARLLESPEPWVPYVSYRGDADRLVVLRQKTKEAKLAWTTQPLEANDAADRTFVFAGALGFLEQPKTDGFLLSLNDRAIVKFDVPESDDATEWKSEDGRCVLKFDVKRRFEPDYFGVFTLTVPKEYVPNDAAQTLTIRSLGEKSARWFGLNPFVDF